MTQYRGASKRHWAAVVAPLCFSLAAVLSCGPEQVATSGATRNSANSPISIDPPSSAHGIAGPGNDLGSVPYHLKAGETATWINRDSQVHSITGENDEFDSGPIAPGKTFSHVFKQPGHFKYFCKTHGEKGEIWVTQPRSQVADNWDAYPGSNPSPFPTLVISPQPGGGSPDQNPVQGPVQCLGKGCTQTPIQQLPKKPCPPMSAQQKAPEGCGDDTPVPAEPDPMPSLSPMPSPSSSGPAT